MLQTINEIKALPAQEVEEAQKAFAKVVTEGGKLGCRLPLRAICHKGVLYISYRVGDWWYAPASSAQASVTMAAFRVSV